MSKAKQKAQELVDRFKFNADAYTCFSVLENDIPVNISLSLKNAHAKQCALVAVDEILNANKEVMYSIDFVEYQDALNLRAKVKSETEIFVYYWQEVKQEIQKL
jgi:predicted proteasome-type protease